jgi:F-type H+-transporting ATPase subunit gamma
MASPREIRAQIASIKKIQKITSAMQNVAASKMRRAQQHMATSMPYATKICEVMSHIASSDHEYEHPYLQEHEEVKKIGYIVVSTDRGLCGGLNLNLFRLVLEHAHSYQEQGLDIVWCLFGRKAELFFQSFMVNVVAHASNLGERPQVASLLGGIKVMLDSYRVGELDKLFIVHNDFVNTLVQKPKITQLLPLLKLWCHGQVSYHSSYIYEPASRALLDTLMTRYIETQVYQAVVDNAACEQVARMIAMKNATESSKEIIENLQLMYNKARQTAITREISEIVSGADAV